MEVRNLLENLKKKKIKTMGRRKIQIKKIEKKSALEVAFSKRRTGFFKKAAQLCVLSGANAAVIVFSPAGKPFLFGHPTAEFVLRRFLDRDADTDSDIYPLSVVPAGQGVEEESIGFWLDAPVENMGLKELEKFKNSVEELREKAADRVEEMAMMMVTERENDAAGPSSSTTIAVEYAPPQLEYGSSSSVLHAQNLAASDDDDSQTRTHTHADSQGFQLGFGIDFDFEFDDFFW